MSRIRDKRSLQRLTRLAEQAGGQEDPLARARALVALRDLADSLLSRAVQEAHGNGRPWREIGEELDIPFQTLFRRHRS